jgi:hypothetical protein
MGLWDVLLWSVNARQYVCNFWDDKLMKSPTRELDLTMRAIRFGEHWTPATALASIDTLPTRERGRKIRQSPTWWHRSVARSI